MSMKKIDATISGYEVWEMTVTKTGNSGHVMVPVSPVERTLSGDAGQYYHDVGR